MAEQVPFGIVQHILIKLGSSAVQRIGAAYGVGKELTKLDQKLGTIRAVLLDAEEKQEKSHAVQHWVQRLRDVMYDADDLLDDYATHYLRRAGLARKVSDFFSSENQVVFRFKMSDRVKDIKERLDDIAKDIPILKLISRETGGGRVEVEDSGRASHSFVLTSEIVGGDENKEDVIKLLVSSENQENLSIVAIVGIGGLGKTTLAQLVLQDKRVADYFEPKIWVCVSDDFDVKLLTKKILKSITKEDVESLELNDLKDVLHNQLSKRRYLLVLDDVWNDSFRKWDELRILLMVGAPGSKILVTTRNSIVASIMGVSSPFNLRGLDENQSWELFSKVVFEGLDNVHPNFIKMGEDIAKMCKGVPLVIKTLGTILKFKTKESQWLSIKNNENLLSLGTGNDNVLSVLKLSYDDLPTHLKQCFSYCALFPKDHEIEKKSLVQLWIAQGYVEPSVWNEHLEEEGDRYFEELLSRSLFQEVKEDVYSNKVSCKMHDFIHDLAHSVVESEILDLSDGVEDFSKRVHHVSLFGPPNLMTKTLETKSMRTFLTFYKGYEDDPEDNSTHDSITEKLIPNFKCLRVLSLNRFNMKKVPGSLGKLSHLRYLDLSYNDFEVLPNAITRLKNLQTLKLFSCSKLKEFPKDTREWINLRHLENDSCMNLTNMPCGIGKLTTLQSLSLFVVGKNNRGCSEDEKIGTLSELKRLNQLRGELHINNLENIRDSPLEEAREANLNGKQYLESLTLQWNYWNSEEDSGDQHYELAMEGLQPHPNLKGLFIDCYKGERFPSWMMNDELGSLLPNLVSIVLQGCGRCQILPPFAQLPCLKSLSLTYMKKVEDMMEGSPTKPFFPSLQTLDLHFLPKLKRLWRSESPAGLGLSFPCLLTMDIGKCHNLTSVPLPSSPCLSKLEVGECRNLASLLLHSSPSLSSLYIFDCPNLESLEWHSSPHLSKLDIHYCCKLRSLKVPSLPRLERLHLVTVHEEMLRQLMFVSASSLKSLSIQHVTTFPIRFSRNYHGLETLPPEIGRLASLTHLQIRYCLQLKSLPEEMCSLKNLQTLEISYCPHLVKRCQKETGEDWPKIAHIPQTRISNDAQ